MTELMIRPTEDVGIDLPQLGQLLAKSGYFADARDAAQCVVKVLAGRELGIGPIAAMTGIYLVKGRVTMSANLMAAQIKRSGRYSYSVAQMSNEACELIFHERDAGGWREIGRSAFTAEDAKLAGLWNSSDPWKKTPRNMLFARAMSNGAKWFCPDIFAGPVYTPDELTDALPAGAMTVDTTTGEILSPTETVVDERPALKAKLRQLATQAKALGLDPGLGKPAEMSDDDLRQAITTVEAMIEAEYEAMEAQPVAAEVAA